MIRCVCSMNVYINVCVSPGNAHDSVNQRHRELFTGALFFGHLHRNKLLFYLVPALKREKITEEKSHTCFRYFRGYIMVCSFSSELSQCSRFFASFVFVQLIQVQEAQM